MSDKEKVRLTPDEIAVVYADLSSVNVAEAEDISFAGLINNMLITIGAIGVFWGYGVNAHNHNLTSTKMLVSYAILGAPYAAFIFVCIVLEIRMRYFIPKQRKELYQKIGQ